MIVIVTNLRIQHGCYCTNLRIQHGCHSNQTLEFSMIVLEPTFEFIIQHGCYSNQPLNSEWLFKVPIFEFSMVVTVTGLRLMIVIGTNLRIQHGFHINQP